MHTDGATLHWQYSSGQDYEFHSSSAAQIGQLYRLKVLEPFIVKVWVTLSDGHTVISWTKVED
jgi:hypothetical protein